MRPSLDRHSNSSQDISAQQQQTQKPVEQRQQAVSSSIAPPNASTERRIKVVKSRRPLQHFRFYLDIVNQQVSKRIEDNIKSLGGVLEFFLSDKVTHFVTDKTVLPPALLTPSKADPKKRTSQPITPTKQPDTPTEGARLTTPTSCESQQSDKPRQPVGGGAVRKTYQSRADILLNTARLQCQNSQTPAQPISTPATPSYKIWQTDVALEFLAKVERDRKAYLALGSSSTGKAVQIVHLKNDFIKIEDLEGNCRPAFYNFPEPYIWPEIDINNKGGAFRYTKIDSQEEAVAEEQVGTNTKPEPADKKEKKLEQQQQTVMTHNTRSKSSSQRRVELNAVGAGVSVVKKGKSSSNTSKDCSKETSNKQFGVCEICKIEYDVLGLHLHSQTHELFAKNPDNFVELDKLIEATADIQFLTEQNLTLTATETGLDIQTNLLSGTKAATAEKPITTTNLRTHNAVALPMREKSTRSTKGKHSSEKFRKSTSASSSPTLKRTQKDDVVGAGTAGAAAVQTTPVQRATLPKSALYKVVTSATSPRSKRHGCAKLTEPASEPATASLGKAKLVIKMLKVRTSEVERLRDDAESIMFPKPRVSSELHTDIDRQSSSDAFHVTRSSLTSYRSSQGDAMPSSLVGGRRTNNSAAAAVTATNKSSPYSLIGRCLFGTIRDKEEHVDAQQQRTNEEQVPPEPMPIIELSGGRRTNNSAAAAIAASTSRTSVEVSPSKSRSKQRFPTAPIQPKVEPSEQILVKDSARPLPLPLPTAEATRKSTRTATAIVSAATESSRLARAAFEAEKHRTRQQQQSSSSSSASTRVTRSTSRVPAAVVHSDDGMGEFNSLMTHDVNTIGVRVKQEPMPPARIPSRRSKKVRHTQSGNDGRETRLPPKRIKHEEEKETVAADGEKAVETRKNEPVQATTIDKRKPRRAKTLRCVEAAHITDVDDDQTDDVDDVNDEDYVDCTRNRNRTGGRRPREWKTGYKAMVSVVVESGSPSKKNKTPQSKRDQLPKKQAVSPPLLIAYGLSKLACLKGQTYSFERVPRSEFWSPDQAALSKIDYPMPNSYAKLPYELGPVPNVMTQDCCHCFEKKKANNQAQMDLDREKGIKEEKEEEVDTKQATQQPPDSVQPGEKPTVTEDLAGLAEAEKKEVRRRSMEPTSAAPPTSGKHAAAIFPRETCSPPTSNPMSTSVENGNQVEPASNTQNEMAAESKKPTHIEKLIAASNCATAYVRASSAHSSASSSCASSSVSLSKKPKFLNKHLSRLNEPARKSPREHASTLALVSSINRQRRDSLSKTSSDNDETQADLLLPIQIHGAASSEQDASKQSEIESQTQTDHEHEIELRPSNVSSLRVEECDEIGQIAANSSNSQDANFASEITENEDLAPTPSVALPPEAEQRESSEEKSEADVEEVADAEDVPAVQKRKRGRPPKKRERQPSGRIGSSSGASSGGSFRQRQRKEEFKASVLLGKRSYVRKQAPTPHVSRTQTFGCVGIRKVATEKGVPVYEATTDALVSLAKFLQYTHTTKKQLRDVNKLLSKEDDDDDDGDLDNMPDVIEDAVTLSTGDGDINLYDIVEGGATLATKQNLYLRGTLELEKGHARRKSTKHNRTGWPTRKKPGINSSRRITRAEMPTNKAAGLGEAAASTSSAATENSASTDEQSVGEDVFVEMNKDSTSTEDADELISGPRSETNEVVDDEDFLLDSVANTMSDSMFSTVNEETVVIETEEENQEEFGNELEYSEKTDAVVIKALVTEADGFSETTSSISVQSPQQAESKGSKSEVVNGEKSAPTGATTTTTTNLVLSAGVSAGVSKKSLRARLRTPVLNGRLPSVGSCNSPLEKAAGNSDIFTVSSDGLETDMDTSNHQPKADEHEHQIEHNPAKHCHMTRRKFDIIGTAGSCAAEAATVVTKSLAITRFINKEVRVHCRRLRAPYRRPI